MREQDKPIIKANSKKIKMLIHEIDTTALSWDELLKKQNELKKLCDENNRLKNLYDANQTVKSKRKEVFSMPVEQYKEMKKQYLTDKNIAHSYGIHVTTLLSWKKREGLVEAKKRA